MDLQIKNISAILIILMAIFFSVIGQIFLKTGLNSLGKVDFSTGLFSTYCKIFISPYVLIGVFIYTISVLFWIYALTKVELSFAYPFVALSYVFILLASSLFLGENVSLLRWLGVGIICMGVLLISQS